MSGGTVALSWGRYGGFYITRQRVCLGWFALTWLPVEIDDLMHPELRLDPDNLLTLCRACHIERHRKGVKP